MRCQSLQIILLAALVWLLVLPQSTLAQGCSDAGFCTMGAMRPDQDFSRKRPLQLRSVSMVAYQGRTRFDDVVNAYTLDMGLSWKEDWHIQLKVPYLVADGPLGGNSGLSDISLSLTRVLWKNETQQVSATLGTKIPTNNGNLLTEEGRPLPMYMQTSLGTYDFVAGISWQNRHWLLAAGYQQPLNTNESQFAWGPWRETNLFEMAVRYPTSISLDRGHDVMLRVERNWRFGRVNLHTGMLPIWRVVADTRLNPATREREEVPGTTGLALSWLAGVGYRFNVNTAVKGLFGYRIRQRENNPDGLSRKMVGNLVIEYLF